MRIKAVILDLDGTVALFNLDYKTVRALVKGYLMNRGVPGSILSLRESVFEMFRKTELWAEHSGKSAKFLGEVLGDASDITERFELEAAASTSLLPGVLDALRAFREMGLKIGLCTINSERSVSLILQRFGIAGLFDVVISRNQVRRVKPDPEHLGAVLRVLGVLPGETVVVGDSRVDMECAKELEAVTVGLCTGVSTVEELMSSGADYVITSMGDLPVLLARLSKVEV
jgi:phosphoglycolate phosphatase